MLELPESAVLAEQLIETLMGKVITSVTCNAHPHGFAWYSGDPALYHDKLAGKKITGALAYGGRPEIWAENMRVSFCDGVQVRYLSGGEERPRKHQLLMEFSDESALYGSVRMYGGIFAFEEGHNDDDYYYHLAKEKPSPYTDAFDAVYFDSLLKNVSRSMRVKAFLAAEQRIPGFGNGVLQDTLWNASLHPKSKLEALTDKQMEALFTGVKTTLTHMRDGGGRDTERDIFGRPGGYMTHLSSLTWKKPCPRCGAVIIREAYLGGNIYYCPVCQPIRA